VKEVKDEKRGGGGWMVGETTHDERRRKCWQCGEQKKNKQLTRPDNNVLQHTPLERIHKIRFCRPIPPATEL
jgi:hypothetical protein